MLKLKDLVEIIHAQEMKFDYLLQSQLVRSCFIFAGVITIVAVAVLMPQHAYRYPYLFITDHFWQDVLRFWPAFVFAIVANLLAAYFDTPLPQVFDERYYKQNLIVSMLAGLTEEGWFRGVGPYFYGLLVLGLDIALSSPFGLGIAVCAGALAFLVFAVSLSPENAEVPVQIRINRLVLFGACAFVVIAYAVFPTHPITMLTENVFYPVINTLSFGLMSDVLPGSHAPLLVSGMLFANFAFRDGHKYQGWFGWTVSWWMGCVFIFATLTYGLFVAMVVHAIFDVTVATLIYAGQKLKPEPIVVDIR